MGLNEAEKIEREIIKRVLVERNWEDRDFRLNS